MQAVPIGRRHADGDLVVVGEGDGGVVVVVGGGGVDDEVLADGHGGDLDVLGDALGVSGLEIEAEGGRHGEESSCREEEEEIN